MYFLGNEGLAGAGLAQQEHNFIRAAGAPHLFPRLPHGRRGDDEVTFEPVLLRSPVLPCLDHLDETDQRLE